MAVPIFHAYAHDAFCQFKYSPRNQIGFGLTDGENVERLWSFLGQFSKMSKEMSSANRTDLLADALSHYCDFKKNKIGKVIMTGQNAYFVMYMYCRIIVCG